MNQEFLTTWNELKVSAQDQSLKDLKKLFNSDNNRVKDMTFYLEDMIFDFSKNLIDTKIINQLLELANNANLKDKIDAMFAGEKVNISENKPATHTFQRQSVSSNEMETDKAKMFEIAKKYKTGVWKTGFGKKVKYLVNIGIGGSYLGPKLAVQAITNIQTTNKIKVHFLPSVDDSAFDALFNKIDIRKTLFSISSKSLGTIETALNTQTILKLLENKKDYQPSPVNQSFVAATTNISKAKELNIPPTHIMPFDNATGGRFSVWSSIGFPVLMAIGKKKFKQFLSGAESVDQHFSQTTLAQNVPVIMALISIWYRNFLGFPAYSVIPYDVRLRNLPSWLQQLMMESNGKMLDKKGKCLDYPTSPIVFGDHGQLSQHAFFQAFHQGKDIIPIDFIGVLDKNSKSQEFLLINMIAQASALMNGSDDGGKNCFCPGNRPSTIILLKQLNASSLGQLLALYEHLVYVQSVIWNINCFDQPGVELGKQIAKNIMCHLDADKLSELNLDESTTQLLKQVKS